MIVPYLIPAENKLIDLGGGMAAVEVPRFVGVEVTDEWWAEHKDLPREKLNAKLGEIYQEE